MQTGPGDLEVDYVIVGAGSAGCVLAARLSADGRSTVALLEAGTATSRHPAVRVPALIQKLPSSMNWLYPTEPDPSRPAVSDVVSAGKGLGGSSVVNAMLWTHGSPADYDSWAAHGATGWDHSSVLPYLRRAESFEDGASAVRGGDGPISVVRTRVDNPMTGYFIAAAAQSGFPALEDLNGPVREGVSLSQVNQKGGLRHTVAAAYLSGTRRRRNLTVVTGARVTRVVVSEGRAAGVEYVTDTGVRAHAHARSEVIVCAGAIGSPRLLLLSGIGPAQDLSRVGVPVVIDSPGVGQGLQEHPGTSLVFEVDGRTVNQEVTPARLAKAAADFALHRRGPLTTTANHAVAFGRSGPDVALPDIELVFMAFGLQAAGDPDASDEAVTAGPAARGSWLARATARSGGREGGRQQVATEPLVTVTAVLLHPVGRGEVTLRSADPDDPVLIRQSLLGDESDLAGLVRAARRAREVFAAPALAAHVVCERVPGPAVSTDQQWAEHLRTSTFPMYHASGTCRMGGPDAVVDERLRVQGVQGLRVVDASVMPHLPSANTHAPTVMIAERASDLVLADRP